MFPSHSRWPGSHFADNKLNSCLRPSLLSCFHLFIYSTLIIFMSRFFLPESLHCILIFSFCVPCGRFFSSVSGLGNEHELFVGKICRILPLAFVEENNPWINAVRRHAPRIRTSKMVGWKNLLEPRERAQYRSGSGAATVRGRCTAKSFSQPTTKNHIAPLKYAYPSSRFSLISACSLRRLERPQSYGYFRMVVLVPTRPEVSRKRINRPGPR